MPSREDAAFLALVDAIKTRSVISFKYDNTLRLVEPHMLGMSLSGKVALRGYQLSDGGTKLDPGWTVFVLAKVQGLSTTGNVFPSARLDYRRDDAGMRHIYAQV